MHQPGNSGGQDPYNFNLSYLNQPQQPYPNQTSEYDFNFPTDPNLYFQPNPVPELYMPAPVTRSHAANQPRQGRRTGLRSGSASGGAPSGSEYFDSPISAPSRSGRRPPPEPEPEPQQEVVYSTTQRGRKVARKVYKESDNEDDLLDFDEMPDEEPKPKRRSRHPAAKVEVTYDNEEVEEAPTGRYPLRSNSTRKNVIHSSDEETHRPQRYSTRRPNNKKSRVNHSQANRRPTRSQRSDKIPTQPTRSSARLARQDDGDNYVESSHAGSADADGSFDDAPDTSSDAEREVVLDDADADGDVIEVDEPPDAEPGIVSESGEKGYALRRRVKVNYAIPPPLEDMSKPPPKVKSGGGARPKAWKSKGLGWSATGAELGRWMGMPADDSDSDHGRSPRKGYGLGAPAGMFGAEVTGAGGAGMLPGNLAGPAGNPSNFGKIGDFSLADADPLGVNTNVTFDEVGGLDDHIHALKEMTLLPLLYPEVFQRFAVTPPRGVLFHGPPGTGKTLLARALAASCRTGGRQISFFMRKGADCLSKWVGEAERQLRLLFEEARACQPSIIFFDEIDGLAPVRSSKQDQIHASIVSTLLALMDGMDGRGQVVVIGATNRPDAVDPALRRPGRFDREFYFPLPNLVARERILRIMTGKWENWEGEEGEKSVKGLAKLTKGYGGADLRALCTEASLNAVQRRYPQIYKSKERLLLDPKSINVGLRDFMISIKKLVPSSARSSASAAAPLPKQLEPLLNDTLESVKIAVDQVLPSNKPRTALEEAEWEDVGGEAGALEREMLLQSMEILRVYRPRVVIHGPSGMGQAYIGAALLHHLEGFHVQSLELGTLFSDSTRTVEAAIVQFFVEAKRHQPSVIYIPSLIGWCTVVPENARQTVRSMLETLSPTDPILLLAIVDGPFSSLPKDVRTWFGTNRSGRIALEAHKPEQRRAFFEPLFEDVRRPPNEFADGMTRKRRVLEELPRAPTPPPRQPTAAELALQEDSDQRTITLLKYRLGPILTELKRKFKRFTKRATEEYIFDPPQPNGVEVTATAPPESTVAVQIQPHPNGVMDISSKEIATEVALPTQVDEMSGIQTPNEPVHQEQAQVQIQIIPPQPQPRPPLFDMDLEKMHTELYRERYLTPQDFLDDVMKIVHNAGIRAGEDLERLYKAQAMFTAAQVSIHEFDPGLKLECERMAVRERSRREERKKVKGKGKASEDGTGIAIGVNGDPVYAPGTRRSGRHNGQQPELSITDPLKLERRLKRQRVDGTSAESHGSEEDSEVRSMKRSKVSGSDEERDPLDLLGPSTSQRKPVESISAKQPTMREETEGSTLSANHEPRAIERQDTDMIGLSATEGPGSAFGEAMAVDDQPRRAGFDPSLLNPLSPTGEGPGYSSAHLQNGLTSVPDDNTSLERPGFRVLNGNARSEVDTLMIGTVVEEPSQSLAEAMVIERSPTPLPEFVFDESRLCELKCSLVDQTEFLSIEQLEQLRATCLGRVWKHRSEWNRDALLGELDEVIKEFLEDVVSDERDGEGDS